MNATIVDNLPAAEYHSRPEWSQSQFKLLPDHPELFYGFHIEKRWSIEPTDDMELGSHLHSTLLEGEPLLVIPPDALTSNGQRRGNNWKAWCEEHPENYGVLPKDAGRIQAMIDGANADPVIRDLLEAEGEVEQTIIWTDRETGLPLRARPDKCCRYKSGYQILDLKATSIDVGNEREVSSKIFSFKYHQQAACYCDAAKLAFNAPPLQFVFVFIRNRPPFNAVAWVLNENDLDLGRRHNAVALFELKTRLASGNWRGGRHGKLNVVSLPKWAWTDDPLGLPTAQTYQEFEEFNL